MASMRSHVVAVGLDKRLFEGTKPVNVAQRTA